MSKVKNEVVFSTEEKEFAKQLKDNIIEDLQSNLGDVDIAVSVQISFDNEGNVRWGHVYVDSGAEDKVWRIIETTKDNFAHQNGFPDILIDVLPA